MRTTLPTPRLSSKRIANAVHERVQVAGKVVLRGGQRLRIHGVTYGPFAANALGQPFPPPERLADDLARMQAAGINSLRTYDVPPEWLLRRADEAGMTVFIDVPWPKHLCFLEDRRPRAMARQLVRNAARIGRDHPCVLAYSIGNEIPPDVVRWHGAVRIERFLAELRDAAKQVDPQGLVTYANYPPTEYLDLSFLDFVTFNVYLHDRATFRRYLLRLQNLIGDKPLLLGEIGMDTLRQGEIAQADFLAGHARTALLLGLAGLFAFSWTDEWHTGGWPIDNWAFGITRADRSPKASYHALRELFEQPTAALLPEAPPVSVVVCTYNGARTLEQCLRSLLALDYPDYEIIVVDDGSTDATRDILSRFPRVRAIHQENHGLSHARNAGLRAATGAIVAYTDSDCFADANWLTHLVDQFYCSGAAAVGGPNLTPEDGWLAACVAASPGQPTHVLESDQVAEHIPGCNMAFRRDALAAINGFDAQYRKAGDDVDVCWRLQQAGHWISFAPGAIVWHHRRHSPRAYLRQQADYGEAEALLRFKHPDKFNNFGDGKWRGVLYGPSLKGPRLDGAIIYRGIFGTGLFQCIYRPGPAHWAMLPATLEWHMLVLIGASLGFLWPLAWLAAGAMLALAIVVAAIQAVQARLPREHEGIASRLLILALCYAQPLARSWKRYRTRLFSYRPPGAALPFPTDHCRRLPLSGRLTATYWTEEGFERTELLGLVIAYLNEHRWGRTIDSGWEDWDLEIYCHPWTVVRVCTAQENHGAGKRLIRVRYGLRPSGYTRLLGLAALAAAGPAVIFQSWPIALVASGFLAAGLAAWWRGRYRAAQAVGLFDAIARDLRLLRCQPKNASPGGQDLRVQPEVLPSAE
jgi:O-antigen biosynthesis protein